MKPFKIFFLIVVCPSVLFTTPLQAASSGCDALVQAAAAGMAADMKADDATIQQPQSVTKFTCLGNFFNGMGLNVITNGLNPASVAQNAMGKICSQLTSVWDSLKGKAQCGLTVQGIDTNFNLGLGQGTFCPTLQLGGSGDTLISAGTNTSGNNSWDVMGTTQLPTGYKLVGNNTGTHVSRSR